MEHNRLSSAVFEILDSKHMGGGGYDVLGSRDPIGQVTIRLSIGNFLFAYSDTFR